MVAAGLAMLLAACGGDPKAANVGNFTRAIDAGLSGPGAAMLCLTDVPAFPSDVTVGGGVMGLDTGRYDEFVRAGLAHERTQTALHANYFGASTRETIRHYSLTKLGTQNLTKQGTILGDVSTFCYASYRVGKIVNFTDPGDLMGMHISQVRWVPKVVWLADWAKNQKAANALPDIKQNLETLTSQEKKSTLMLTNTGWEISQ